MECRLVSQKMRLERAHENPRTCKGDRTVYVVYISGMLLAILCAVWLKDVGARVENYFDSPRHPNPHNHNTMAERRLHCNCDFMVHRRKVLC